MRIPKRQRQNRILQIIKEKQISRQEEIVEILQSEGYSITQATISRDLNELRIVKMNNAQGKTKFVLADNDTDLKTSRLLKVFAEAVVRSTIAGNLIIIHTLPGMAPASASAIDALEMDEIAGTIAGDDCIFIAIVHLDEVKKVERALMKFVSEDGR